ncbi:MAG: ATP-dependent helicase, partial [Patescibacteria group bacterium]
MNILDNLNEAQKKAVCHADGPLLIVAGAGTGKTKSIVSRISWLVQNNLARVDEILALTFTDKSANELLERVDIAMPYGYGEHWISTFNGFCDKILKRHAHELGLNSNYRLLTETDAWILVRQNLEKFDLDYFCPAGNPSKFIKDLLKYFSRCKDEGISAKDYCQYAENLRLDSANREFVATINWEDLASTERESVKASEIKKQNELANAYFTYQKLLRENNALDFNDQIFLTWQLMQKSPLVLAQYRQQFKYVLIDEFQDTNYIQYELIKLLVQPKNNLTVVGDDDQSIYKFRGASISNIMQFMEDFPTAQKVVLTENYRSGQRILDCAYNFIVQNNPNRLEVKLGIDKKLIARNTEIGECEVNCLNFATGVDEASGIIEKIKEIKRQNSPDWSDFAILFRAKSSAEVLIDFLEREQIPYQFLGESGLYNRPAVIFCHNFFKLLDDYHESSAMYRILTMPQWNLKQEEIIKI